MRRRLRSGGHPRLLPSGCLAPEKPLAGPRRAAFRVHCSHRGAGGVIPTVTPYRAGPGAFSLVAGVDVARVALTWRWWLDDEGARLTGDDGGPPPLVRPGPSGVVPGRAGAWWVRTGQKPPVSFSRSAASASSDASVPSAGGASEL